MKKLWIVSAVWMINNAPQIVVDADLYETEQEAITDFQTKHTLGVLPYIKAVCLDGKLIYAAHQELHAPPPESPTAIPAAVIAVCSAMLMLGTFMIGAALGSATIMFSGLGLGLIGSITAIVLQRRGRKVQGTLQ